MQTQVTARDSAGAAISPRPAVTLTAGDVSIASTDAATTTVNLLRPGCTTVTAAVSNVLATSTVNVRGFERLARVNQDTMCALADGRQRIYCRGSAGVTGTTMITSTLQQFQYVAPTPIPQGEIPAGARISKVEGELFNMCALTDDGAVFCWGSGGLEGSYGIGIGVAEGRSAPTRIAAGEVPAGVRFVDLSVTANGACAVGDDGRLYCWGFYSHIPNPALPSNGRFLSPVATGAEPASAKFTALTVGGIATSSCAVADNGKAYCWGRGYQGSAGDGVEADHEVLTPVEGVHGEKDAAFSWSAVNCSQYTCTGLASDRRIYSRGSNQNRMLSRESAVVRSALPLMVTRPTRP